MECDLVIERATLIVGGRLGEAMLFYGCRSRNQDCILPDELADALNSGVLSCLQFAYSREQVQKVYVQHLLRGYAEAIWSLLKIKNGHFYVCGYVLALYQ